MVVVVGMFCCFNTRMQRLLILDNEIVRQILLKEKDAG